MNAPGGVMTRGRWREALEAVAALAVGGAVLAVAGAAFSLPWRDAGPVAGEDLERFVVEADGSSFLRVKTAPDGEVVEEESTNVVEAPGFHALASWRAAPRTGLSNLIGGEGVGHDEQTARVADVRAFEAFVRTRTDQEVTATRSYTVLTDDGLHLVGLYDEDTNEDTSFDPPALLLPPALVQGTPWETTGIFQGYANYRLAREIIEVGAKAGHDDCLSIETEFDVEQGGEPLLDLRWREWLCAGVGVVESTDLDADGEVLATTTLVSRDGMDPRGATTAAVELVADETPLPPAADWELDRVGRGVPTYDAATATFAPVYVASDPPVVLLGNDTGDVVAFDAESTSVERWRFHTGGDVYGSPVIDTTTGRLYFGATDKRVYALDVDGLFQWSFATDDAVVTRPALAPGLVVFGSEDRTVYAVDSESGEERWRHETRGPVAGSPVIVDDTVVIGADDGGIYGLDVATGAQRWLVDAGSPITAPVVAGEGGVVVVATFDGDVVAVDTSDGNTGWQRGLGAAIYAAPAVDGDRVYVVDSAGFLTAIDAATGEERWYDGSVPYAGAPLVTAQGVVATTGDGTVYLLDRDGAEQQQWSAIEAKADTDGAPAFGFGPTAGGGALWLTTDDNVLLRLGARDASQPGATRLRPAWFFESTEAPMQVGDLPAYTPLDYQGEALLLAYDLKVFGVDEAGSPRLLGELAPEASNPYAGGTVAGDTILASAGGMLYAASLPELEPRWQFAGNDVAGRPPVVADETVLWVTRDIEDAAGRLPETRLHALDLTTGRVRWEVSLDDALFPSGVVVVGDLVVAGPGGHAVDLDTGEARWRPEVGAPTNGTPAASGDGETVFIATLDEASETATVAAVAADDGELVWEAPIPAGIDPTDRLQVDEDVLVVPLIEGTVVGLDLADGEERWRYSPEQPTLGSVTVDDGSVWLATENGQVVVLDASTGEATARFSDMDVALHAYAHTQAPGRVGEQMVFAFGLHVIAFDVTEVGP